MTSGCENQWGLHLKDRRLLRPETNLLRGLHRDSLAHKLTHSAQEQQQEKHQGHLRRNNFRARAEGARVGATLSGDGKVDRHHCFSLELPYHPPGPVQVGAKCKLSTNLANTTAIALMIL